MATQTLTVKVPSDLYARLAELAQRGNRSVEEEVLDLLADAAPNGDELPADLREAVASLPSLDDESLWRAARSRLAPEISALLEMLHFKQQREREGLSAQESQVVSDLLGLYDRNMLVRAHAAALLKERGHDVNVILTCP